MRPLLALCLALATSCSPPAPTVSTPPSTQASSSDNALTAFSVGFLDEMLSQSPVMATGQGDHRFDDRFPDVSAAGDARYRAWLRDKKAALGRIDTSKLSAEGKVDAAMIANSIDQALFSLDELREAEHDPMYYTGLIGDGFDPLVTRSFTTPERRRKAVLGRLSGLSAVVAAAKARLVDASPLQLETALTQAKGLLSLLSSLPSTETLGPEADRKRDLEAPARAARAHIDDLIAFLDGPLRARARRDPRLGKALFTRKLALTLDDDVTPESLTRDARAMLERTQREMADTSRELWPTLFKTPLPPHNTPDEQKALVRTVLAELSKEHYTNDTIVREATRLLDEATTFVRKHDLVRLPDEPCRVIEMPEYRRGVAIAYCDASGPLEEKPETFFAISPTPADWPEARVKSFYREYNSSMLADLVVHEAMPGHFLQLMANNRFPSKLRAVLGSGPFIEGWAVYTEWLMAKHGFGGPKVRLMRQKMVLRLSANAILDSGVHAGNMTEQEAMALMTGEAFQEEGEAAAKWRRANLTSAQLSTYFYGFRGMLELRSAHEKRPGFKERAFHDEVLAHGSPSIRHLRALLGG